MSDLAESVERSLGQRQRLVGQLVGLCVELTDGLADIAEDDGWARGQLEAMRATLAGGVTARGVRDAGEMLRRTREQQARLRAERTQARDALKGMIGQMLGELGELGAHTGRFQENVGRYATVIDSAESLEGLASVVGDMLSETRSHKHRKETRIGEDVVFMSGGQEREHTTTRRFFARPASEEAKRFIQGELPWQMAFRR